MANKSNNSKGSTRKPSSGKVTGNKNAKRKDSSRNTAKNELNAGTGASKSSYKYIQNDPSWYTQNSQLVIDTGNINFANPVGNYMLGVPSHVTGDSPSHMSLPGIMCAKMEPVLGYTNDYDSIINTAARAVYTTMTAGNSRNSDYEYTDVMVYILAAANAYAYLSWMQRLYGITNTYSQLNRFIPAHLVEMDGVDFDSIRTNIANFRGMINRFATQLAAYPVPKVMPLFDQMQNLYSAYYTDGESPKSSIYMYSPSHIMKFSDSEPGGSALVPIAVNYGRSKGTNMMTYTDLSNIANEILSAMNGIYDVGLINADILKFYGTEGIKVPELIDELYTSQILMSDEMLDQFHNITVFEIIDEDSLKLYQGSVVPKGSYLISKPRFKNKVYAAKDYVTNDTYLNTSAQILDTRLAQPTPADVLTMSLYKATANHFTAAEAGTDAYYITRTAYGVCSGLSVGYFSGAISAPEFNVFSTGGMFHQFDTAESLKAALFRLSVISTFEWRPILYVSIGDKGYSDASRVTAAPSPLPSYDFHNYTTCAASDLNNIHLTQLYSLLNVPGLVRDAGVKRY